MTHINIKISKAVATAEKDGIITTGMVGVPVSFMFDSWWDGLIVTAVFKGSGAPISVPLLGATETVVPWEVLKRPCTLLRIGAEGRLPDGTLVIPTTWATVGAVMSGANATDDLAKPPTPTAFDRIMSQIGNMNDLTTEAKDSLVAAINEAMTKGGGEVDPEAVQKIVEDYLASNPPTVAETDPTVPAWAKQPEKPSYTAAEVGALPDTYTPPNQTAQQVGADPAGTAASAVSQHNTDATSHNDLRLALKGLSDRINVVLDSDDATLDQLSEVVAYIKSNKSMIDAVTTSKVSVADIVDNLTTNASGKVLSAAQGVALKSLIDAITMPTTLPNPNALTFTGAVTGSYDGSAPLSVDIPSGGGSGGGTLEHILDFTTTEEAAYIYHELEPAITVKELLILIYAKSPSALANTGATIVSARLNVTDPTSQWYPGGVALANLTKMLVAGATRAGFYRIENFADGAIVTATSQETKTFAGVPTIVSSDISTISNIRVDTQGWANNFAAGSQIRIYGVMAHEN